MLKGRLLPTVMEIVIRAKDRASDTLKGVGQEGEKSLGLIRENLGKITAATGVAGAALEGFARRQGDTNATLGRMAFRLGENEDSLRSMINGMTDYTFSNRDAVRGMERLSQAGVDNRHDFERLLPVFDQFADATGKDIVNGIGEAERVLGAFNIPISEAAEHMDTITHLSENLGAQMSMVGRRFARVEGDMQQMNIGLNEGAAGIEIFMEKGMNARDATRAFINEIRAADGDWDVLLANLGMSQDEFDGYVGKVLEAEGTMQAFADINNATITPLQRLQAEIQNAVASLGGFADVASGLSPIFMGTGGTIWGINQVIDSKRRLAASTGRVATALRGMSSFLMGPWGVALAAATVGIGLWMRSKQEARQRVDELKASLDEQTGAITENTREWVANALIQDDLHDAARDLGLSFDTVVDAAMGNAEAQRIVAAATSEAVDETNESIAASGVYQGEAEDSREAAHNLARAVLGLADATAEGTEERRRELEAMAEQEGRYLDLQHAIDSGLDPSMANLVLRQQEAKDSSDDVAEGFEGVEEAAEDAADEVVEFIRVMEDYVGDAMSVDRASIRFAESLHSITERATEAGGGIDIATEAGRQNRNAVMGATRAMWDEIDARLAAGESIEELMPLVHGHVDALIEEMEAIGLTEDEIQELIEAYGLVPEEIITNIEADDRATSVIGDIIGQLDRLPGSRNIGISATTVGGAEGGARVMHTGGRYYAPSPGGEGLVMLQDGETVGRRSERAAAGGGGGSVHIEDAQLERLVRAIERGMSLDGRRVSKAVGPSLVDEITGRVGRRD